MDNQDQTGANFPAEAAVQPDFNAGQSGHEPQQDQMVPVTALQAERRERQQLQENFKVLQDHLTLLQATQNQRPQTPQEDEFSGLRDTDVLTVGEAKKFMSTFQRQQKLEMEEVKISRQYSDYDEVVRKYLPNVLKEDPELKDMIMNAPNPYKAAYVLAKKSDSYLRDKGAAPRSAEAQKAATNMQRPGNLSSIGSASSAQGPSGWKSMNDADFMKKVNQHLGGP